MWQLFCACALVRSLCLFSLHFSYVCMPVNVLISWDSAARGQQWKILEQRFETFLPEHCIQTLFRTAISGAVRSKSTRSRNQIDFSIFNPLHGRFSLNICTAKGQGACIMAHCQTSRTDSHWVLWHRIWPLGIKSMFRSEQRFLCQLGLNRNFVSPFRAAAMSHWRLFCASESSKRTGFAPHCWRMESICLRFSMGTLETKHLTWVTLYFLLLSTIF